MRSNFSIVVGERRQRDQSIVRRDPEKTRSGSADIGGIVKMSIASLERLGYVACWVGSSHQSRGVHSIIVLSAYKIDKLVSEAVYK